MRHHLVQKIILAYDAYDRELAAKKQQAAKDAGDRREQPRPSFKPKRNQ